MATNIEQANENLTNVGSNLNVKSVNGDGEVVEKKKSAFGDIKNTIDPNLNKNDKGKDEKIFQEIVESTFGATTASNEELPECETVIDQIKGTPVDFESAWADQWILPLYNRIGEWCEAIHRSKMENPNDDVKPPTFPIDDFDLTPMPEPMMEEKFPELPPLIVGDDIDEGDATEFPPTN